MALTSAQRQQRWRNRLRTAAQVDQLGEAQAARDLAEQRRIELDKLDIENAKLFRDHEKLKRDIAGVRHVRDELRAEVYRLRKEVGRARTAWDDDLTRVLRSRDDDLEVLRSRAQLVKWVRAAMHPDRVTDPEAKAYLHDAFIEFSQRVERR